MKAFFSTGFFRVTEYVVAQDMAANAIGLCGRGELRQSVHGAMDHAPRGQIRAPREVGHARRAGFEVVTRCKVGQWSLLYQGIDLRRPCNTSTSGACYRGGVVLNPCISVLSIAARGIPCSMR